MAAFPWRKIRENARWAGPALWQRSVRWLHSGPVQLIIALADHFEPAFMLENLSSYASLAIQEQRLERWCRSYPKVADAWRDSDGKPFVHTYFFPAEQYNKLLTERLASHCYDGWGEVEIHLHHGVAAPDDSANTRRMLAEFRDKLTEHGCLSRWEGKGPVRYGFVHGNWALANSGDGLCCGVDDEMQILAETGCYADFTLPSAPHPAQISKVNSLYECALPFHTRAPHRRGRDLRVGHAPSRFPLIIQGPLTLELSQRGKWGMPRIENGALTSANPASVARLELWRRADVAVRGRPDWVFIKLHCHGMDPRDEDAMLGQAMLKFLHDIWDLQQAQLANSIHFVTAREMTNIILAACDGRDGNPGDYRDYRLRLIHPVRN